MDRKGKSRKAAAPAESSMAALADAAVAGNGADAAAGAAEGGALPVPHGEGQKKPAGASAGSSPVAARRGAASAFAAVGVGGGGPSCQVERCGADLSAVKKYCRRHKVCEAHYKDLVVLVGGLRQRFCQQCSRFHELSEFDDKKRSCRQRLVGHNARRRKSSAEAHGGGGGGSSGGDGGDGFRHADQDGRSHPGNPPPNPFHIR